MKKHRFLWILVILSFFIRLFKIHLIYCIAPDGIAYINTAKDLIAGKSFNSTWPPLYPFFLSLLWNLISNPELCGQLISVLFGVLTVVIVYVMLRNIFDERIALIAALFAVFHPYLVRYSAEVLADSIFTFLITAVVFLGWVARSKKKIYLAPLTGIFAALAYLTKPEGIFLLVVVSFWWLFENQRKWIAKISRILFAWFVFLIICFPYFYSIKKDTGQWMISQKQSIVFSIALKDEGYTEEFLNVSPAEFIRENPKKFLGKMFLGFIILLGRFPDAFHPVLFLLFLLGLTKKIKVKQFLYYILSFLGLFFIGYAIFHPGRRYLVGWVPVTLFIACYGVDNLNGWLQKSFKNKNINYKWIIISITILIMLPKTFEPIREGAIKWKTAGLWIMAHSKGSAVIMSEDSRAAFYAGGKDMPFDENKFMEADYIVTDKEITFLNKIFSIDEGLNIYYGKM